MGDRGKVVMRKRNFRLIIVGVVLLGAAGLFFLAMMGMIPRSNDPAALMSTVGQVSGVVGGISIAMIIVGLIGKKAPTG
jgi:hypothetical protein